MMRREGNLAKRILVATGGSSKVSPEIGWAAQLAEGLAAELLAVRVVGPEHVAGGDPTVSGDGQFANLVAEATRGRGRALTVIDSDPAAAILRIAEGEAVDIIVVGGAGMNQRGEFLLASLPNRISHNAKCTVVIVNDGVASAPQEKSSSAEAAEAEPALLGRVAEITRVMAKHGVRQLMAPEAAGEARRRSQAKHFRQALEELGPTFAKLGQILSTRPDLLPREFIDELSTLQDKVTPLTEAEVVKLMEEELRVPWEDVFQSIEPEPMAAGSIAQVHRAVIAGGARVVVKVQRPNAGPLISRDLALLDAFIQRASQRPAFRQVIDLPAILAHLSSSLRRELDFRQEAANISRLGGVLGHFNRLHVPQVYENLSTARLLVMEEIQGGPVFEAKPEDARQEAARQLLESFYEQVLGAGFFHADPHPGNLLWASGSVYFLDCGMVGELSEEMRDVLLLLLLAFWQEDAEFLGEVMLAASGSPVSDLNRGQFSRDLQEVIDRYRNLSLKELRLGPLLEQATRISLRHGVRMPADLALVGKAFGQVQLTVAILDPTLDPFSVAAGFLLRRTTHQARDWLKPGNVFYQAQKLRFRVQRFTNALEGVVGARPGSNLQVDFYGTEAVEATIQSAARRLSLAVAAGFSLLGIAVAASFGHQPAWLVPLLIAAAALLFGGLAFDLVRYRR